MWLVHAVWWNRPPNPPDLLIAVEGWGAFSFPKKLMMASYIKEKMGSWVTISDARNLADWINVQLGLDMDAPEFETPQGRYDKEFMEGYDDTSSS